MNGSAYLTVRNLPTKTHASLRKLAAANRRSLNAEVVIAIEGHIANARSTDEMMAISARIRELQKNRTVEVPARKHVASAKGKEAKR